MGVIAPADDAEMILLDSADNVVAKGKTDDTGTWKTPKLRPGAYRLTVRALANHERTVPIVIGPIAVDSGDNDAASDGKRALVIGAVAITFLAALIMGVFLWKRQGAVSPSRTDVSGVEFNGNDNAPKARS